MSQVSMTSSLFPLLWGNVSLCEPITRGASPMTHPCDDSHSRYATWCPHPQVISLYRWTIAKSTNPSLSSVHNDPFLRKLPCKLNLGTFSCYQNRVFFLYQHINPMNILYLCIALITYFNPPPKKPISLMIINLTVLYLLQ